MIQMPQLKRNARDLAVFAFANLLSLGVAMLLSALCALPFAFMGGYIADRWLDHPPELQTDVSLSVQGAGIFMASLGAFVLMLLVSLWFIFPGVSRFMDRKFFPHVARRKVR